MMIDVFIAPHERHEALEAYRQWLTPELEDKIDDAPETAIIRLRRQGGETEILVIEEG